MTLLRLTLPGAYEDAFVYMGHLFAIRQDNSIVSLNLEEALWNEFSEQVPAILNFYFVHNDWLDEDPRRPSLIEIPEVSNALTQAAHALGEVSILGPWKASRVPLDRTAGRVLDIQAYRQRLYISATKGLLDLDFVVLPGAIEFERLRMRTDARCLNTSTKYGTVVASCGEDGLLAGFDDFGDLQKVEPEATRPMIEIAAESLRAGWLSYNIANYHASGRLDFFSGHKEERSGGTQRNSDDVVSSFSRDSGSSSRLEDNTQGASFVFNSNGLFFVQRESREFELLSMRQRLGKLIGEATRVRQGSIEDALSAHVFPNAVIVECFEGVYLLSGTEYEELHAGPALKVRTFPSSKQSRNLITVIDDEAIHILSPIRRGRPAATPQGRNRWVL